MGSVGQVSGQFGQSDEDDDLDVVVTVAEGGLGPEPDVVIAPADDTEGDDEVEVPLDHWSDIAREAATERLREAGIPHWWVGESVHGAARDEPAIRQVLDEVEGTPEPLDPDEDQVAYDMSEWDDDRLATLEARLGDAEIAFGWDVDELFVYAADEDAVDALIEAVEHPHELAADGEEAPAGEVDANLLGDLFVIADQLQHDPKDHEQVAKLLLASQEVDEDVPPYGFAKADWRGLTERVDALADLLCEDEVDEDAVADSAKELRGALRPFV